MKSSLQPSSISTYQRAWNLSYQFLFHILPDSNSHMPVPPQALLIAHLFDWHYAASSFNTYVSAIGYSHKLASLPDTTKTQMLKGYEKIGTRLDSRLPLTLLIPQGIISAPSQLDHSFYNTFRFQAMCSFAFHTFQRMGKITNSVLGNTIHLNQVLNYSIKVHSSQAQA